jgi:hypothetical protein
MVMTATENETTGRRTLIPLLLARIRACFVLNGLCRHFLSPERARRRSRRGVDAQERRRF